MHFLNVKLSGNSYFSINKIYPSSLQLKKKLFREKSLEINSYFLNKGQNIDFDLAVVYTP